VGRELNRLMVVLSFQVNVLFEGALASPPLGETGEGFVRGDLRQGRVFMVVVRDSSVTVASSHRPDVLRENDMAMTKRRRL
jgi:hypothetical protein